MIGPTGVSVDVEIVEVGMTVLALDLNTDTDADMRDVQGGTVIAIATAVDTDTGEIQRRFICAKAITRDRVRFTSLRADQVREVLPFSSSEVWRVIQTACRAVGAMKHRGLSDARELLDTIAALKEKA